MQGVIIAHIAPAFYARQNWEVSLASMHACNFLIFVCIPSLLLASCALNY